MLLYIRPFKYARDLFSFSSTTDTVHLIEGFVF